MPGPYISDGNYRFGVTHYTQPYPPEYNCTGSHRVPNLRQPAADTFRDDGVPYTSYLEDNTNPCATCGRCNRINRNKMLTSLVNLETSITKFLRVKLYGATQDLNKTVLMKEGNKYCISYLTEQGVATVTGTYRGVSTNVPEECTSFIGNYSALASSAYICMDCSTAGTSDKRLIYIASIRYIEEVYDEGDDPFFELTQEEKIKSMVLSINDAIATINNYVKDVTNSDESSEDASTADPTKCPCYNGSTLITHDPDKCYCCGKHPSSGSGSSSSDNDTTSENPDFNALVKAMENVRSIMNSFIYAYNIDQDFYGYTSGIANNCCCTDNGATAEAIKEMFKETGVPIVEDVPEDATDRGLYIVEQKEDGTEEDLGDIGM